MSSSSLQERVEQAAEVVLKRNGSVGLLELFQEIGWLSPAHFENWRKGHEEYSVLQSWIHAGPGKQLKAVAYFQSWVSQRGLRPIEAAYTRRGPHGIEALRVSEDPAGEKLYHIHYTPGDLPAKKAIRLTAKLNRPPSWS